MARKLQATTASQTAAGLILSLWLGAPALAQESPGVATPVMPAPFSRDCQVANDVVITDSPLPNVTAALQKRKTIRILAIGASAMAHRRARGGGGSYTAQIEQILEHAVKGLDVVTVNRGVSGELAADAVKRIKTEVALTEPDLVLWQVGTNDALAYVPIDELRDTIVEMIRWLKEHKVDVVLVGLQFVHPQAQDDNYRAVRELIRSIAAQERVVVVRRGEAMRLITQAEGSGGGLFPDEFAKTEAGYACLAEYVARAITLGAFGRGLRPLPLPPGAPQQPPPGAPAQAPAQPAPARP
jgi:lysophospholipase L1-like esterase